MARTRAPTSFAGEEESLRGAWLAPVRTTSRAALHRALRWRRTGVARRTRLAFGAATTSCLGNSAYGLGLGQAAGRSSSSVFSPLAPTFAASFAAPARRAAGLQR